jgi:hypothetical protein
MKNGILQTADRVLALIVTYNGENYIEDCLKSLLQQTISIDILVVDNASEDRTRKIIDEYFTNVKLINVGYNSGFAHANNIGLKYAIDENYDYVLMINEDTIAEKTLVSELIKNANNNTATIPKIFSDPFKKTIWYAAGNIDFKTCKASNVQDEYRYTDQCLNVNFMTGCCMLLHTAIIKKVGFFDEDFFMYYEDTDLSLRMYENGINMIYVPSTSIWHRIQNRRFRPYQMYYIMRNRLYWIIKHKGCFQKSCFSIILSEIKRMVTKPNVYDITFIQYQTKGIVDFIKGKKGKM